MESPAAQKRSLFQMRGGSKKLSPLGDRAASYAAGEGGDFDLIEDFVGDEASLAMTSFEKLSHRSGMTADWSVQPLSSSGGGGAPDWSVQSQNKPDWSARSQNKPDWSVQAQNKPDWSVQSQPPPGGKPDWSVQTQQPPRGGNVQSQPRGSSGGAKATKWNRPNPVATFTTTMGAFKAELCGVGCH